MIPNEVNEAVIRMIDYALDEDKEFINVENGSMTLYTMLVAHSTIFTSMVCICLSLLLPFWCSTLFYSLIMGGSNIGVTFVRPFYHLE